MAETNELLEQVYRMIELLTKIEENTRPEKIDEKNSKITGFSAGDKK